MEKYGESCDTCPLKGKADVVDGHGPADARFLIVTDSPSHKPETYGRLLSQASTTLFSRAMRAEKFEKDDFYFYPHIRCAHDPDVYTTKEKSAIQKCCRPYLVEKVNHLQPEAIIPLGATPAKQVFKRAVKITQVRGMPDKLEEFGSTTILPMLNPLMAVLYPQHQATINSDAATLGRLVDNDYDADKAGRATLGEYEIIDDLQFLIDMQAPLLAFDTEGTKLRWFHPGAKVLTLQFSVEPGKAYLLPWDKKECPQSNRSKKRLRRQLRELLCNPNTTVVGQNAKYDATMMAACVGVRYPIGGDTLVMAALLDENSLTKNQSDLVKRYVPAMAGYDDVFNATVDKSRMDDYPLDEHFIGYACGDADSLLRLNDVMYTELMADARLLNYYHTVSLPGLNAFVSMELRGLPVDEAEVDQFETFMAELVTGMYNGLIRQVPRSIKRAHVEKGLAFSRPDFVRDILFYHEDGFCLKPRVFTKGTQKLDKARRVPSTSSKDHLPFFYDECPFTFEYSEYVKAERVLTTNVRGFKSKYIFDGVVRPIYNLHVAVTGRTSSEDPNGQNFPKRGPLATAYRRIFIAPEDYYVIEADLSQAELRIAAEMANDPTMLRIYREGGDIHQMTAMVALRISATQWEAMSPKERKVARTKAKAINFGFLYGMGWRGFVAYAKTQYGVQFTDDEAKFIRETFFLTYSNLTDWHEAMREQARKSGFVRSISGRVRHLPMIKSSDDGIRAEAERQAINSPVQEFGSTLGVISCGRIDQEIEPDAMMLVGFVHDALYSFVPKQYAVWGAKTMQHYMESNDVHGMFGRNMRCPIVADVALGNSLGEVYEMGELNRGVGGVFPVDDYDDSALWDEEKDVGIILPPQLIPPNNGRRIVDVYGRTL